MPCVIAIGRPKWNRPQRGTRWWLWRHTFAFLLKTRNLRPSGYAPKAYDANCFGDVLEKRKSGCISLLVLNAIVQQYTIVGYTNNATRLRRCSGTWKMGDISRYTMSAMGIPSFLPICIAAMVLRHTGMAHYWLGATLVNDSMTLRSDRPAIEKRISGTVLLKEYYGIGKLRSYWFCDYPHHRCDSSSVRTHITESCWSPRYKPNVIYLNTCLEISPQTGRSAQ